MKNPVEWFEIYVEDMERAKTFYQTVFDFSLSPFEIPGMEMWGFPMQEGGKGAMGALVKMEGMPSGGNSVLVYFSCHDCGVTAEKAASAGGKIQKEKTSIGQYGFIALVLDSEGNMIGLHSVT